MSLSHHEGPMSLWKHVPPRVMPSMREIAVEVEDAHRLRRGDLIGSSRKRPIARARQEFMWRARQVTFANGKPRYSLPMIGAFLGGRDHATIIWGVRRHEERMAAL